MLDRGAMFGIKLVGGRTFNLRRLDEMEEDKIPDREKALKNIVELEVLIGKMMFLPFVGVFGCFLGFA